MYSAETHGIHVIYHNIRDLVKVWPIIIVSFAREKQVSCSSWFATPQQAQSRLFAMHFQSKKAYPCHFGSLHN